MNSKTLYNQIESDIASLRKDIDAGLYPAGRLADLIKDTRRIEDKLRTYKETKLFEGEQIGVAISEEI